MNGTNHINYLYIASSIFFLSCLTTKQFYSTGQEFQFRLKKILKYFPQKPELVCNVAITYVTVKFKLLIEDFDAFHRAELFCLLIMSLHVKR